MRSYGLKFNNGSTFEVYENGELLGYVTPSRENSSRLLQLITDSLDRKFKAFKEEDLKEVEWKWVRDPEWGYSLKVASGELKLFNPLIKKDFQILHVDSRMTEDSDPISFCQGYISFKKGFYNKLILDNGSRYLFNEGSGKLFYDSGKNQITLSSNSIF